ncbi:hypothetical protein BH10ACI1_BH10ACI1_02720 [soil metagenome]
MKRRLKFYNPKINRPTLDQTISKYRKQSRSKFPLRLLGVGSKELHMTEEEREVNFHVIGGSRQGKSKFLEYNIRKDIDMGFGLCLIDPSDFGATFNAVLDYCVSINHQKVCIIDPNTLYDYGSVACIQPLNAQYPTKSAQSVKDAINLLLGSSEVATPRIQENLDALLRMLAQENMTLHETSYFVDYERREWAGILEQAKSRDAQIVKEKFKSYGFWKQEFTTTVTRLSAFRNEPVSLMVGGNPGIDFKKMVDEGWVILCNLFPEPYLDLKTSTFLGILVISQIINAVDTLNKGGNWGKKFYLYIDEAGSFATPQIKLLLNNKSKSGLHLIFAHHHFSQFANQTDVLDAINHNTGIKVMFALRDETDRIKMMKQLGFGSNSQEASERYAHLPVQHAVIMKNKENAMEVVTPRVDKIQVTDSQRKSYIQERLLDSHYLPKYDIEKQIESRIKSVTNDTQTVHTPPPIERTVSDRKTDSGAKKTGRKSLLDFGAEAEKFIRDNKTSE